MLSAAAAVALLAAACSSTSDTSSQPASCAPAFYVSAGDAGATEGPLPDQECAQLCGKKVFSCSATGSDEAGAGQIECQPDCASSTSTSSQ